MGTNYYLHPRPDCECCGRPFESLHIGKSSGGWCFSLHVIPEDGINNLEDWRKLWNKPSALIKDEYGICLSIAAMESKIEGRSWSKKGADWNSDWWKSPFGHYESEREFHRINHSERGPNFLLRHQEDGRHCLGHGPGTYDYIAGEFS